MKNKLFYRHIIISLFALFLFSNKVWPANKTCKFTGLQSSIKFGYVMPFQNAFREEYKQQLFIGNIAVPVSIGFASQFVFHKGFGLRVGCDMARFKATNGPITLSMIDATIGPTYSKHFGPGGKFRATASIGLGPSWALAKSEYQEYLSTTSYQTVQETIVYRSICTQMEADMQYNIKECFNLGTYIAFYRKKYDSSNQGGFGILSGVKIGLHFTITK